MNLFLNTKSKINIHVMSIEITFILSTHNKSRPKKINIEVISKVNTLETKLFNQTTSERGKLT